MVIMFDMAIIVSALIKLDTAIIINTVIMTIELSINLIIQHGVFLFIR